MKMLFVTEAEYHNYMYTANRQNRIHRFWIDHVLKPMPKGIHIEVRKKPSSLQLQGPERFNISGVKPYQFTTKFPSDDLYEYLSKFVIFVENPSKWTKLWREDVKKLIHTE